MKKKEILNVMYISINYDKFFLMIIKNDYSIE